MTVFSTPSCAMCKMLITRMEEKELNFNVSYDEEAMIRKGIASVPVLELDDGTRLGLRQALRFVEEGGAGA